MHHLLISNRDLFVGRKGKRHINKNIYNSDDDYYVNSPTHTFRYCLSLSFSFIRSYSLSFTISRAFPMQQLLRSKTIVISVNNLFYIRAIL